MYFQQLRTDVRYALRWLSHSPGFSVVAIASLAIGIGFNAALFSVVDALLLRPLPVERPDRLVDVYTRSGDGDTHATSSYPDYQDFRDQNQVFTDLLAYSPALAAVKTSQQSRMALAEVVTGNYFQVLGVPAALGRTIVPDDDRKGAPRVVMLSDSVWRRDFARDINAVGRTILIHGQTYTIVGVAPPRFTGILPMLQPELWLPLAWVEEVEPAGVQDSIPSPTGKTRLERRGQRWLFIKARLKDQLTAGQAQANMELLMKRLAEQHPKTNTDRPVRVVANVRLHPEADRLMKPIAAGLMIGVGLVLLVACVNVTNMLLARASARQRELGIRLAIGASRGRLIRQLLTEGVVLGLVGAAAGIAVAFVLLRAIQAIPLPIPIPLALALRIDSRVLIFSTAVAMLAGVLAALAPALRATRLNVSSDLKAEPAVVGTTGRRWTLRDALIVSQTALTLVLLVGAGLLTRSILEAQRLNVGFRPAGLSMISAELGLIGYTDQQAAAFFERAIEKVRTIPGVTSVTRASRQPLSINMNRQGVFFPERPAADQVHIVSVTWVDPEYFETIGVPLLRGRNFTTADTPSSAGVVIVNSAFVKAFWPEIADPVGRRFRTRGLDGPEFEVVGVVGDYKVEPVGERPRPYVHHALAQRPSNGGVLIARTASDSGALLTAMKREMLALEPNAVFIEEKTMEAQVDMSLMPARLAAQTAALVGVVATVLAAIGLYGTVAYAVARRTREIGIRIALGAAPRGVVSMVMRQGLVVACGGIALGLLLTWPAARALASGLYGISAFDPLAWSGAIAVLLMSAGLANYVPARRAARVDPSVALRSE
jgi:putative ABC transport system permease protein